MNYVEEIMSLTKKLPITPENYPDSIEDLFQVAIARKRTGDYNGSLDIYMTIFNRLGKIHTGMLNGAFKTIAAAGYVKESYILLEKGNIAMRRPNPFGMKNGFQDHMERIDYAIESERELYNYLKSISGNVNYRMPRDYKSIYDEFFA